MRKIPYLIYTLVCELLTVAIMYHIFLLFTGGLKWCPILGEQEDVPSLFDDEFVTLQRKSDLIIRKVVISSSNDNGQICDNIKNQAEKQFYFAGLAPLGLPSKPR